MTTVSRPINGITINGDEYLLDERGEVLRFSTVKESLKYFMARNYGLRDLITFDFNIEEADE
jgi:hypothetical protein